MAARRRPPIDGLTAKKVWEQLLVLPGGFLSVLSAAAEEREEQHNKWQLGRPGKKRRVENLALRNVLYVCMNYLAFLSLVSTPLFSTPVTGAQQVSNSRLAVSIQLTGRNGTAEPVAVVAAGL